MVDKVLAFIAHNDDDSVEVEVREEEQGAVYELGAVDFHHTFGVMFSEFSEPASHSGG